ncbi:N2227-domain-containing protein [Myriangium duriaei CBS 260.36]|uniref:carnosine N-methyltransferase n=1 Tax=Myriangium duriaei CBS 260.36 TaxID=1168546 RepID=A0A9P4ITG5_9PEZI|nr:N2227-domain-containing protein [Myriangium duriaei CBS 260.36]
MDAALADGSPPALVTNSTRVVVKIVRWMWMRNPGAFGKGKASCIGFAAGEEPFVVIASAAMLICGGNASKSTGKNTWDKGQYRRAAHYNITHLRRQSFYSIPAIHSSLLSERPFSLPKTFQAVDDAIDKNADIAEAVLTVGLGNYGVDPDSEDWKGVATPSDMDKVKSTIRQLYRDFSTEGAEERRASFEPMIEALNAATSTFPPSQRHKVDVLIPGAGLGRLVLEVCAAGYRVEGNEISYHQLLVSNWILNYQPNPAAHECYPWALSFSNHISRSNQLQKLMIPDVAAGAFLSHASEALGSEVHAYERMSMTSGDFCVVYKEAEYRQAFDAVLTCFFIDTAPNVISYIETVKHCLRAGGVWINMGPLLWHFEGRAKSDKERTERPADKDEGIGEPGSFELTDEEMVLLLQSYGFQIKAHDNKSHETGYIQDPNSMLKSVYRPSFWVAAKT